MKLDVDNLSSGYGTNEVLHGITFSINSPGITVVLGKNGAGKTTLFRALVGLLSPMAGTVSYNDEQLVLGKTSRKIGYLTHTLGIPSGFTVSQLIDFYSKLEDADPKLRENAVHDLELNELMNKKVNDLSQGQKKRASLLRCFLNKKEFYIFDEPTANLDPVVASEIRADILKLSKDSIILYSSHNLYEAKEIGNQVISIDKGKIGYMGAIDQISRGTYKVGIRARGMEKIGENIPVENKYYIFEVKDPSEVGKIISDLVSKGATIYEVKDMENPLEKLYGEGEADE